MCKCKATYGQHCMFLGDEYGGSLDPNSGLVRSPVGKGTLGTGQDMCHLALKPPLQFFKMPPLGHTL